MQNEIHTKSDALIEKRKALKWLAGWLLQGVNELYELNIFFV